MSNSVKRNLTGMIVCGVAGITACTGATAREIGIDVSQFQGTINWTQVKGSGQTFAFIRATRGGQTSTGATDSVDDTNFTTNIINSKAAGMLVSPYHFARPDVLLNGSITQDAQDEAQHFLSIAGAYMGPGYLRPVLDLESGGTNLTAAQLSQWMASFCNMIIAAKGAGANPIVYCNTDYAYNQVDTSARAHALWLARPLTAPYHPQTDVPPTPSGYNNPYGVWNSNPTGAPDNPGPWSFWQYGQSVNDIPVPGISGNVDLDVFHSETGSISSFIVPEPAMGATALFIATLARRRRRR